jgi:hypothetical protein
MEKGQLASPIIRHAKVNAVISKCLILKDEKRRLQPRGRFAPLGEVSMKRCVLLSAVMLVFIIAWTLPLQGTDDQPSSLGTLARQLRAQRADAAKKTVKVFTNDDLHPRPPGEGVTAASGISSSPAAPAQVQPGGSSAAKPAPGGEVHDQKYYREEKATISDAMEIHQRELAVLQQKSAQSNMQYYPDPNKTLQQEFSRSDINKLNDQIEKKQQQIAADEKALDDLRDQLRREGGDPGWLR